MKMKKKTENFLLNRKVESQRTFIVSGTVCIIGETAGTGSKKSILYKVLVGAVK